jgi:uncharacterized protein YjbJ (UPF0337 family)
MGWDQLEGKWKQIRGQVKEKWDRLSVGRIDVTMD